MAADSDLPKPDSRERDLLHRDLPVHLARSLFDSLGAEAARARVQYLRTGDEFHRGLYVGAIVARRSLLGFCS